MNNEKLKRNAIINEIVTFLLHQNAKNICFNIDDSIKKVDIEITCDEAEINDEIISKLKELLNVSKTVEIEEYYWQLVGDITNRDDLYLVGNMIDKADIRLEEDNKLKIMISRVKDN